MTGIQMPNMNRMLSGLGTGLPGASLSGLGGGGASGGGLMGMMGGMNSAGFGAIGGGAPGLDAASLSRMGVSGSSLMLMAQINTMMASVLSGIGAFMQQIMASAQARQQAGGSSLLGSTSGATPASGPAPGSDSASATTPASSGSPGERGFVAPLSGDISGNTGDFGPRVPPTPGASSNHKGVDIARPEGTPVMSTAGGRVAAIQPNAGGAGNMIVIDHGNGITSRYLHLSGFADGLKVGDSVNAGQVIGRVGNTGISTGAHLHFEILENGTAVDPVKYLPQLA